MPRHAEAITQSARTSTGQLLQPGDAGDDQARRVFIEHFHGAATRVPVEDTAWAKATFAALAPLLAPALDVNYLESDAADAASVA